MSRQPSPSRGGRAETPRKERQQLTQGMAVSTGKGQVGRTFNSFCRQVYLKKCHTLRVRPMPSFVAVLENAEVEVYVPEEDAAQCQEPGYAAMCAALAINHTIKRMAFPKSMDGSPAFGLFAAREVTRALKANQSLTSLVLEDTYLDDECAELLAAYMGSNTTLFSLNLNGNNFSERGAHALSRAIATNTACESWELSRNPYCGSTVAAAALASALRQNKCLTHLGLGLERELATKLLDVVEMHDTLVSLSLTHTKLTGPAMLQLSDTLRGVRSESSLCYLDLTFSYVGDEGMEMLATALSRNRTLTALGCRSNAITSKGALMLAEMLHSNDGLTNLDLNNNEIGDHGAIGLADAITHSPTITCVDVGRNPIGGAGAHALMQTFSINPNLVSLGNLDSAKLGVSDRVNLMAAAETNSWSRGQKEKSSNTKSEGIARSNAILPEMERKLRTEIAHLYDSLELMQYKYKTLASQHDESGHSLKSCMDENTRLRLEMERLRQQLTDSGHREKRGTTKSKTASSNPENSLSSSNPAHLRIGLGVKTVKSKRPSSAARRPATARGAGAHAPR